MRKNDPEQVAKYLRLKVIEFSPPVTNPVNPVKLPEEPLYLNGAYDAYADLYGKMLAGYFTKAV